MGRLPSRLPKLSFDFHSTALKMLLILACIYTVRYAKELLFPLTLALILSLVFAPIVRGFYRRGIPPAVTSAIIVIGLFAAIIGSVYSLTAPITSWINRSPYVLQQVEAKLYSIKRPVKNVKDLADRVEDMTSVNGGDQDNAPVVVKDGGGLLENLLSSIKLMVINLLLVGLILFYLLSGGRFISARFIRALSERRHRRTAMTIARQTEREISRYLFTITLINIGLGSAVGAAMYALGMPDPLLWAILIGILNYVPYIGMLVSLGTLTAVALVSFDGLAPAAMVGATFITLNIIESEFVTPLVLGRRFTLNPVIIVTNVAFWGWLWGVPGILLAVPLLVAFKILCEHLPALYGVGAFLGAASHTEKERLVRERKERLSMARRNVADIPDAPADTPNDEDVPHGREAEISSPARS